MSDQNPHLVDTRHSQIPVGCPTSPTSGLTLMGALYCNNLVSFERTLGTRLNTAILCDHRYHCYVK